MDCLVESGYKQVDHWGGYGHNGGRKEVGFSRRGHKISYWFGLEILGLKSFFQIMQIPEVTSYWFLRYFSPVPSCIPSFPLLILNKPDLPLWQLKDLSKVCLLPSHHVFFYLQLRLSWFFFFLFFSPSFNPIWLINPFRIVWSKECLLTSKSVSHLDLLTGAFNESSRTFLSTELRVWQWYMLTGKQSVKKKYPDTHLFLIYYFTKDLYSFWIF